MTETAMLEWFDILQDKYNTPSFSAAEKYNFLNDSQLNYVNRFLEPDTDQPTGWRLEESIFSNAALQPIIVGGTVSSTAGGLVTKAAIVTALSLTEDIILPLAFALSDDTPVKFARHNDIYVLLSSGGLKAPTTSIPVYTVASDGYTFKPATTYSSANVVVLKMPVDIASGTDCELPSFTHRKIVAGALTKTGFVTEHQALTLMDEQTNG